MTTKGTFNFKNFTVSVFENREGKWQYRINEDFAPCEHGYDGPYDALVGSANGVLLRIFEEEKKGLNVLMNADYSELELRVAAQFQKEGGWAYGADTSKEGDYTATGRFAVGIDGALKAQYDPHTELAAKMFGIPEDQVTQEQRRTAKSVNFSKNYGGIRPEEPALTNQSVFDQVWEHFVVLEHPRAVEYQGAMAKCRYRTEDGKKCVVGIFIRDEEYDPSMEDKSLQAYGHDFLPERLHPVAPLLVALQEVHDQSPRYYSVCVDEEALRKVAGKWGLRVPPRYAKGARVKITTIGVEVLIRACYTEYADAGTGEYRYQGCSDDGKLWDLEESGIELVPGGYPPVQGKPPCKRCGGDDCGCDHCPVCGEDGCEEHEETRRDHGM